MPPRCCIALLVSVLLVFASVDARPATVVVKRELLAVTEQQCEDAWLKKMGVISESEITQATWLKALPNCDSASPTANAAGCCSEASCLESHGLLHDRDSRKILAQLPVFHKSRCHSSCTRCL